MTVKDIADALEAFAPLPLQESYDNAGLLVGRPEDAVHKALLCVDITEEVMDEAEAEEADMIVAHHPVIFHPLKRLNSTDYIQRVVERAVRRGIALYAAHTNLDSTPGGLSWRVGSMLSLESMRVLSPARKEEPGIGFGVVGRTAHPVPVAEMLQRIRTVLGARVVRYSDPVRSTIERVALCTGSGGSLIGAAIEAGADLYIASDMRYNDFLDARTRITLADIGHYESERCAIEVMYEVISKKFPNFALRKSANSRNPINYLA